MKNLKNWFLKLRRPHRVSKPLVLSWIVLSFIGFADAAYLTIKHYQGEVPPCSVLRGCEIVTTSQYASMWGVPVALLGTVYYVCVLLLAFAYLDTKKPVFAGYVARLTSIGFGASLYFLYLQLFIIHAICLYCVASALTSIGLFITSAFVWYKDRRSFG